MSFAPWPEKPIGSLLCERPSYGINAPATRYSGALPTYIRITDITSDGRLDFSGLTSVDHPQSQSFQVSIGDILVARTGASVGKSYLHKNESGNFVYAGFLIRLRGNESIVMPYILYSLMNTSRYWSWVATESARTGQPGLNALQYASFAVPLPPMNEQHAIAEALGDVDALIGALDALIAKKRDVKRGAMQRLLTGATRLLGFSEPWERVALGARGHFAKGQGISRAQVQGHGLPCVRYGEIYTHHHDKVRAFHSFISPEVAAKSARLSHGDLLFTASGETAEEIGKCVAFLRDEEAYAGGDIVLFRPAKDDAAFLGYLMNHETMVRQKMRRAQGDMVVHISARSLSAIEFDAPQVDEQRAIAAVLSDMDAEIEALGARRAKTADVKKGMMRDLLTGRVRLSGTGEKRAMEAAE